MQNSNADVTAALACQLVRQSAQCGALLVALGHAFGRVGLGPLAHESQSFGDADGAVPQRDRQEAEIVGVPA